MNKILAIRFFCTIFCLFMITQSFAHHVLGRPAYSLNEDSNTPPAIQIEMYVGDFNISYTVFPAFPKPGDSGRINFHAAHVDTDKSYIGNVTFKVKTDSWFSSDSEVLGVQQNDDYIYHQEFVFSEEGHYIVTAEFQDGDVPYLIDFPLKIGSPTTIGTYGAYAAIVFFVLLIASTLNQKRLQRFQTKRYYLGKNN